mmetsp:Transcript_61479/g.71840  ORF Transcript_61479/g.71840 Transcript_61479/m.71840 type:complete len:294 (+) Transcript_61479:140-1021(+)|eukprot:CAMPEP_0171295368 /NCGR_PEP_ID=MMETSP0816-20121228/3941_1 /TAXON_ID=420281 /ORGANISM="Proboscia inermis, Strain CCAP1064/1" /LENGTH=293 /DNA_ID=CAMNT_0011767947 /DNA_START=20 /DNA_END=901 /DNA_ORIENTATION=+
MPGVETAASRALKGKVEPLSTAGIAFFTSLCAGTFGLGCWQYQRYYDKVEKVSERKNGLLNLPPIDLNVYDTSDEKNSNNSDFDQNRTLTTRGRFHHNLEILVGLRGPPRGVLAKDGPMSGKSGGGMASSPHGYYIVTPFERSDGKGSILINRGWVPRTLKKKEDDTSTEVEWNQPSGEIDIVAVKSQVEEPKTFSPDHNLSKQKDNRHVILLWMERPILEKLTYTDGQDPLMLTEIVTDLDQNTTYPVSPDAESISEFNVMPMTHAGYAATWFGLSGVGMLMTRKLITRGRG